MRSRPTAFGFRTVGVGFVELVDQAHNNRRCLLIENCEQRFAADEGRNTPRCAEIAFGVFQLSDHDVDRGLTVCPGFQREQVGLCCERSKQLGGQTVGQH